MIIEEFCSVCILGISALVGSGIASQGLDSSKEHKKQKKIMFWSGISVTVVSLIIIIYLMFNKDKCKTCFIKNNK